MNLNIIVRGYLYKKNWVPNSTAKRKFPKYTQNFRKLIRKYKELFNKLSQKYQLNITFTSYDNCPEFMKKIIFRNNWNLHLIKEKNSTQFSSCCSYLETVDDGVNLIIRSDLILKEKLINLLANFDYQKCKKLTILSKEPYRKLNDILFIAPSEIISKLKEYLKKSPNGHNLGDMSVLSLDKKKWYVTGKNDYYQIYRGQP